MGKSKAKKQLGLENSQRDNDIKGVWVHAKQGLYPNLYTGKGNKKNVSLINSIMMLCTVHPHQCHHTCLTEVYCNI